MKQRKQMQTQNKMQNKRYKALAGSGKTTKLKEEIKSICEGSSLRVLLLSFNKKLEQENKHLEKEYSNLSVKTFHSLAWGAISRFGKFKCFPVPNYRSMKFHIKDKEQLDKVFNLYCDSKYTLEEFKNVQNLISAFGFHNEILDELESLINELDKTKTYTHSYYLKKFQLLNTRQFNYDIVLIDEYQDFTDAMISVIEEESVKNNVPVIIAGDYNQKIYRWKNASGEFNLDFSDTSMPKTWRCPQQVVDVANKYITWLSDETMQTHNQNKGTVSYFNIDLKEETFKLNTNWIDNLEDFSVIARTNSSLIYIANLLCSSYNIKNNLSLNMQDIEDHYLFVKGKKGKNYFLNGFKGTPKQLQKYYNSIMQQDKSSLVGVVQLISDFDILKNAIENHDESKPTLTISTVFSAKGLEWDKVLVMPDFKHHLTINKEDVLKVISADDYRYLYVAITRAKKELCLPKEYDTKISRKDLKDFVYLDDIEGEDMISSEIRHFKMIQDKKSKLGLLKIKDNN